MVFLCGTRESNVSSLGLGVVMHGAKCAFVGIVCGPDEGVGGLYEDATRKQHIQF
jgi:hypothetical protein